MRRTILFQIGLALFSLVGLFAQAAQVGRVDATPLVVRLTVTADGRLYAWDKTGKVMAGWPKDFSADDRRFVFQPRLTDIDFDLQEEIIAVSKEKERDNYRLHVFRGNGQEITARRFEIPESDVTDTPWMADVDHDSLPDTVIAYSNGVSVYRSDGTRVWNKTFEGTTPFVSVGDPDNNGLEDLFIVAGTQVHSPSPQGGEGWGEGTVPLPFEEKILGPAAFVDIDGDNFEDIVVATENNRLAGVDRNGKLLLNVRPPDGGELASPAAVEDIDLDRHPELIVLTKQQAILAFETNGTLVTRWKEPLLYRQTLPEGGVIANDIYQGLFSTATGWDLYTIYRNKLGGYSHLLLGENVHDYDTRAEFQFVEAVAISDLFAFPKLFTPNGDGVNDTTQIHYRLSDDALITLDLYSAHGRFLSHILEKQPRGRGEHQETVLGIDTKGSATVKDDTPLATGTYIIKVLAQSKDGFVTSSDAGIIINGVKAEIESPKDENTDDALYPAIYGKVTVSGVAIDPNFGENSLDADFKAYKMYWRAGVWNVGADEAAAAGQQGSGWNPLPVPLRHQCPNNAQNEPNDAPFPNGNVSCRPVQHGELATFDASDPARTPNGDHTILLKVVDSAGNDPAKLSFDTRVVTVKNPLANDPTVNPQDLFDPRNPLNPVYRGPSLTNVALSSASVSRENPSTTIRYTLENKTANIYVDVFPVIGGSLGAAVSSYSFARQAPAAYNFLWNGTNTLGRNVDGGHYKVRITASAFDGRGQAVDESLEFDVARGFSSRDVLAINSFESTPQTFDPFGFGNDLEPEKAYLSFGLTKEADVSLEIYSAAPEQGGTLQKTLLRNQRRRAATVEWDGTADNGIVLTAGRSYIVRLTAVGADIGNDERVIQDVTVTIAQPLFDANITANLDSLKGDESEDVANDGELRSMVGNSAFLWRAKGVGYVEMPFTFTVGAEGSEEYRAPYFQEETRPMYACYNYYNSGEFGRSPWIAYWMQHPEEREEELLNTNGIHWNESYGGFKTRSLELTGSDPLVSFEVRANDANGYVFYGNEGYNLTENAPRTFFQTQTTFTEGNTVHVNFYHKGDFWDSSCVFTGIMCPNICVDDNGVYVGIANTHCGHLYPDHRFTNSFSSSMFYTDNGLHQCGSVTVRAQRTRLATRSWPFPGQTNPSPSITGQYTLVSNGTNPNLNVYSYDGVRGSGNEDTIAGTVQTTAYTLSLSNTVNGVASSGNVDGASAGSVQLPGVAGWLNSFGAEGGQLRAEIRDNFGNRLTAYQTERDDPYTIGAPYRKIWGRHGRFNRTEFHRHTDPINIYAEGYRPNIFSNDPGTNLYSFSDAVRLTNWTIDVRYPNVSVDRPDGDNALNTGEGALGIFDLEAPNIAGAGVRGFQNSHIEDNFRLKLLPEAQPKRFVEIWGSAPANYALYYYDASKETQKWVNIPVRTHNAVSNDILAHWDVTKLNGKNYTLILKAVDEAANKVNQDTFNIGIGTTVDTQSIGADAFVRVDSAFKRATLLFPKDSLPSPELVTINPVPRNEADFALPAGIAPIGPIFDIQPDGLQTDPARHVQLELAFAVDELRDTFGVADPADVQIYHLAGDELLEGLATTWVLDTHDNADPTDDVYRFTAFLEHFSQYLLVKKQIGEFKITSPSSDGYLKGQSTIAGTFEKEGEPVAIESLTITLSPETLISSGTASEFNIPWDVSALNGQFTLIFEARNAQGDRVRHELPVAIDNTASQSTLLVNGRAVADGAGVTAGPDSVIEIKASDPMAGVASIAYGWDGAELSDYLQSFTVPFQTGTHSLVYRAVDKNGNAEEPKQAQIQVEELAPIEHGGESNGLSVELQGPFTTQNGQRWVNGETQFAIRGRENNLIKYRAGFFTYRAYEGPFNLQGKPDGLYVIEHYWVDDNGLRGDIGTFDVFLDATPPVTSVSFDGAHQQHGAVWMISPETRIILKATDDGESPSGLSRVEYRWGNDGEWAVYREPLSVVAPGVLAYRAVDRVGNVETEKAMEVLFDADRPTLSVFGMPSVISPNGDSRHDTAEFSILAADNFSKNLFVNFVLVGGDGQRHRIWEGVRLSSGGGAPEVSDSFRKLVWDGKASDAFLPEDIYTYEIRVTDARGNLSGARTGSLVYDLTPPEVTLTGAAVAQFSPNGDAVADVLQAGYSLSDNLLSENIRAELHVETPEGFSVKQVADTVSVPPREHVFSWDGTNLAENPAFDGTYRYKIVAEDAAGNRSEAAGETGESFGQIFIDRLAPQTVVEITGPRFVGEEKTWLASASRIRLNAADPAPGSGVGLVQYAFGDAAWTNYAEPFVPPLEGIDYTLRYQASDAIGNREMAKTLAVRLDRMAPRTEISVGEPKIGEGDQPWISPATPITLTAADTDGSGVASVFVETPEVDEPLVYDRPFGLAGLADGLKRVTYWAEDRVGNEESRNVLDINLDGTPPVTRLVIGDPKVAEEGFVYISSETPLDFETTAERSDLQKTEYQINGDGWRLAGPFKISREGDFSIEFKATDTLGNIEPVNIQKVVVDNTPPDPLMAFNQGDGDVYITRQTKISLDGNATGAGMDFIEYKIDDGAWQVYKGPFGVADLGAGSHIIIWRSRDKLGNRSAEKKFTANLIDVTVTRADFVVPRTLVYLLQTFDLRVDDQRPNAGLLAELLEEMGGYTKITDKLDEFIGAIRSDKFTTYIFATDSLVVNFSDENEQIQRTFKELKSRIDKGEAFINLAGFSKIGGKAWEMFRQNWEGGEPEVLSMLGAESSLQSAAKSFKYGNGHIVEVTANAGSLAVGGNAASVKSALADLIEYVRPKSDVINAGEVIDSTLTFSNSGDQPVTVSVKEIFPAGGFIETKATGAEVPTDLRTYDLTVPALGSVSIDYLYRMPFEATTQRFKTDVVARWKTGVVDKTFVETPYHVEKDLNALLASVSAPLGKVQASTSKSAENIAVDLDSVLQAIDATPRAERSTHLNLDETLESLQLSGARESLAGAAEKDAKVDEPTSFHGPTGSFVKGGCSLNETAESDLYYGLCTMFYVLGTIFFVRTKIKGEKNE